MNQSELKCELLLEFFITKEKWREYKKRSGSKGLKYKAMDNYMDVLDIYELIDYSDDKEFIMYILQITDRAYDTLFKKYRSYRTYKRK